MSGPMYVLIAERPCATAPERSIAALSTSLIFSSTPVSAFAASAQRMISYAAPQHAMPPPISRMSSSSSTTLGLPNVPSVIAVAPIRWMRWTWRLLATDQLFGLARAVAAALREVAGLRDVGHARHRLAAVRVDRALAGRADRELETLQRPVAE